MDNIMEKISHAATLEDLIPLIISLSRETAAVAASKDLSDDELDRILRPLAAIRTLLGRLDLVLSGPTDNAKLSVIRGLAATCLDLEGRLKERRNDHSRPRFAA